MNFDIKNNISIEKINIIDRNINSNLELLDNNNRGFISQNILAQLRNYVETILVFYYGKETNTNPTVEYDVIKKDIKNLKANDKYKYLFKLQQLLQITESHYTQDTDESTRLMIKYIEFLLRIKKMLEEDGIYILHNINKFPINLDPKLRNYYKKINHLFNKYENYIKPQNKKMQRCYVQSKQTIICDEDILYEIVLSPANDNVSKFDRVIVFTKSDIPSNYAISVDLINEEIEIDGVVLPISLILTWECSIRPCELRNMARIFNYNISFKSTEKEYKSIMNTLMSKDISLLDITTSNDDDFNKLLYTGKGEPIFPKYIKFLIDIRDYILENKKGNNVLKYLLYTMNNVIIKDQYDYSNQYINGLYLSNKCLTFDATPLSASLRKHNVKKYDVINAIGIDGREDELLARKIINNSETNKRMYTNINELYKDNIEELIRKYNGKLYYLHKNREIKRYKDYVYIDEYETNTKMIIDKLIELTKGGISSYSDDVEFSLMLQDIKIDDENKKEYIRKLFINSNVAIIYGAAGTGKTTFINLIANIFDCDSKLFIANTNPAVQNLKNKVKCDNSEFMTIKKSLKEIRECRILFIDECSTISNIDMVDILNKIQFELLVIVGDTYQLDSIRYGNWFELAQYFVPKDNLFYLNNAYRTSNKYLIDFWNSVRNLKEDCMDKMVAYGYSSNINDDIYVKKCYDEIILCLNYGGLYGVNNLNRILQSRNKNQEFKIGLNIFKTEDPILFNDSNRFQPTIYNNMKGTIKSFVEFEEYIDVIVELEENIEKRSINSCYGLEYVGCEDGHGTMIKFQIEKNMDTDEDNDDTLNLPFQLAYAVSIHKSQGLEYESVKIVIASDSEERITHDVFYTAVTRAKNNLKVYWSPETMNNVFKMFEQKNAYTDAQILAARYNMKIHK